MKITQEEVLERQTVLHIELEDDDLDKYLDRGYRRVVQRTMIPGFRKGKAPRRIVENFVGREALLNEIIDSMVPEVTGQAIDEQKLDAAGLPQIELIELDPLILKAVVPLTPSVELGAYKELRIAKEPGEVTKEDLENRLDQLRQGMASWEPVERPVKMGDMVTLQALGKVDGDTILEQNDAVVLVDGDSPRPLPGFSQHIVDMVIDESKEFSLSVPEDFQDPKVAGKEAHFSVTLTEAKERLVPELDDEFAKGVGEGFDSLAALREKVESDLQEEAETNATQQHRDAVVSALVDSASIEVSPVMVDHEVGHMLDDRQRTLARINVRMDDYLQSIGRTEEDMRNELREEAVQRINRTFVLTQVAEDEGLEVSAEEVDERIESLMAGSAEQTPEEDRQVSDEARESVQRALMAEKTVDRLVAYADGDAPAGAKRIRATRTKSTTAKATPAADAGDKGDEETGEQDTENNEGETKE